MWRVACVVLCACGRLNFDPGRVADAADRLDTSDASMFGPFGPPVAVTALNTASNDYGPSVTPDTLTLAFNSDRAGQFKLYASSRASAADDFAAPVLIAESDQIGIEYDAELSADATELIFHSEDPPAGLRHITRATVQDAWTTPALVAQLADYEGPNLFANDLRMVVSRANSGGIDELARQTIGDPWQLVRTHSALGGQKYPGVRADGLELFTVSQSGRLSRSTRNSVDDEFGPLEPVVLGLPWDSYNIYDPELSGDARQMFLSIDPGQGNFDIYVASR